MAPLDAILENYDPKAAQDSTLNRGDVLEIQGPAGSGKTQMLQFFAMTTCLPRTWEVELTVRGSSRPPRTETIAIGGRHKSVIVLDCDGRFKIERTYQLVRSHLTRRVQEHAATIPALYSAEASGDYLHAETLRSLARVHVFAPASSLSLSATLLSLPRYIRNQSVYEVAFVLIDNISAFYWQDRYQTEQDLKAKVKVKGSKNSMRHVMSSLYTLREKLGIVTILTNWAFPMQGDRQPTSSSPFYRQHLPKPYPSPFSLESEGSSAIVPHFDPLRPLSQQNLVNFLHITHHLTLHSSKIKLASKDVTMANALREEPFRSMEQQEIGSMAYVRIPGIEGGDELGRWELVIRQNAVDGL